MALTVLGFTMTIETTQFFIGRIADIDDVITNFFGGMSGFSIYVFLECLLYKTKKWKKGDYVLAVIFLLAGWVMPLTTVIIDVRVSLGDEDKVVRVEDQRQYHDFLCQVPIMSPEEAIKQMQKGGYQRKDISEVRITEITEDVLLEKRKGHLQAAWTMGGVYEDENGEQHSWVAKIPAMK